MTDWIEHNGGPQPVADDVWVQVCRIYSGHDRSPSMAAGFDWPDSVRSFRILNQHLIDAALRRGIELGLDAAGIEAEEYADRCRKEGHFDAAIAFATHANDLRAIDPDTIAKEAGQ